MTVSLENAEPKLSDLIDKAAAGEEVVFERDGKPVARLLAEGDASSEQRRRLGLLKGRVHIPDDFDAPLPDEVLRGFGVID